MFRKASSEPPAEKYLIELCEEAGLRLIKEHFKGSYRYLVKDGDILVSESRWASDRGLWAEVRDETTAGNIERWMKSHHIEVTTEVLVS